MSAKGSKFLFGKRDYIFGREFFKKRLEGKTDIPYEQCGKIIETCNKIIAEFVKEEQDGFKLPYGLGYLCVTRYVSTNPAINWQETNKLDGKKYVYHTNFHTFGYSCKIAWFRVGRISNKAFHEVFKFKACRELSRTVSKLFSAGRIYSEWSVKDFMEKSRLENLYNKKFRKELKS